MNQNIELSTETFKFFDKFGVELKEGDIVDVQIDGEHEIYKKEDGNYTSNLMGKKVN